MGDEELIDYDAIVSGTETQREDVREDRETKVVSKIHKTRYDNGIRVFNSKPAIQKTDIEVITEHQTRKETLKTLAYDQLERKLSDRTVVCPKCFGDGKRGEKDCTTCHGQGTLDIEADMRAIELVLKPEYPKTSVSIHANIDSMNPHEVINLLQNMFKKNREPRNR
jgi:hypothetical protein